MQNKGKFPWFQKPGKKRKEHNLSSAEGKPVNLAEERLKKKKRSRRRLAVAAALLLVLVLILQVWSTGISRGSFVAVEEEVLSAQIETGGVDQVLKSSGVLANATEEAVSIPGDIEVTSYLVKNGDVVEKGDPIALIKESSVMAAIADLQEMMDELDGEMSDVKEDSISSTIKATVDGTVVKVYATSGTDVVDTMYDKGALLLISLDGLLAVEIENPGDVKVGSTLTVKDADGNAYDGQVASVEKETVVVTVSLNKFSYGEKVTVWNGEEEKIGSGKLYIYSQQKITGYSGTVSSVKAEKGDTVSKGDTLLTLSNTDYTAAYQTLLNKRTTLENQYNELVEIGNTGYIYAASDGTVSGIEESLLTDQAAAQDSGFLNMAVKTGGTESGNVRVAAQQTGFIKTSVETGTTAESDVTERTVNQEETISRSINLVWMNGDSSVLTEGMPENVTIQLFVNGVEKEEQVLNAMNNWGYTWSGLSKYDSEGQEITYTLKIKDEITGYVTATQVSGTVTLLICTKQEEAGGNSQNPSDEKDKGTGNTENPKTEAGQNTMPDSGDTSKDSASQNIPFGMMQNQTQNQNTGKGTTEQSVLGNTQSQTSTTQTEEEDASYVFEETTICYFIPNDTVEVEITVDELDIHSVKEGQTCMLTLDAFPSQSFTGTVKSVNKAGTNSGGNTKYTAVITMEKEADMLTGMNASVQIVLSTQNNVQIIPEAALVEQDGKVYVYTTYDKKKDELGGMAEVTTGVSDGENVQIVAGLEEGQQIYYRYAGTISYTFLK